MKGIITKSIEKFKDFLKKEKSKGNLIKASQTTQNGQTTYKAIITPKK